MVLQIDADATDTIESCASKALSIAKLLGITVKFYFNRGVVYVEPTDVLERVASKMQGKKVT